MKNVIFTIFCVGNLNIKHNLSYLTITTYRKPCHRRVIVQDDPLLRPSTPQNLLWNKNAEKKHFVCLAIQYLHEFTWKRTIHFTQTIEKKFTIEKHIQPFICPAQWIMFSFWLLFETLSLSDQSLMWDPASFLNSDDTSQMHFPHHFRNGHRAHYQ